MESLDSLTPGWLLQLPLRAVRGWMKGSRLALFFIFWQILCHTFMWLELRVKGQAGHHAGLCEAARPPVAFTSPVPGGRPCFTLSMLRFCIFVMESTCFH